MFLEGNNSANLFMFHNRLNTFEYIIYLFKIIQIPAIIGVKPELFILFIFVPLLIKYSTTFKCPFSEAFIQNIIKNE